MRRERPLFSVLIDNYNYGCYLEEAIESVLNQTFPQSEIEIIVVDDGSTDDSSERLRKYKDKVRCIFKENGGQASAFNVGVEGARGEFIAFLDSDDYWHPDKLRLVADEFEKSESLDFVYHFLNVVDNCGRIIDRFIYPSPFTREGGRSERYLDRYLKGTLPWFSATSGMVVRAERLRKTLPIPNEFRIFGDIYLHYILPFYIRNLSLIKRPLGYYRLHDDNLSGGNLLTLEKVRKEKDMLSLIKASVEQHAGKLGHDSLSIINRLESSVAVYEIVEDILSGKRCSALKNALTLKTFLSSDNAWYRFFKKATLLIYIVLPPPFWLWLQRRYRSIVYSIGKVVSIG